MNTPIKCSIGITAYNEGKNIHHILKALYRQKLKTVIIDEIIVISSGSTDNTNKIVTKLKKSDPRIRLIKENKRNGKASAVNLFIDNARNEILVLESADTIPEKETIEKLVSPFRYDTIGITGSHPVPINSTNSIIGYAVHCEWALHHEISLKNPKMGETIAFRKSFKKIPVLSAVDEVNIEALIRGQGYKALYVPQAIVRNKGPETFSDWVKQRRRIYAGHLATKKEYSYVVSTSNGFKIFAILIKKLLTDATTDMHGFFMLPRDIFFAICTILIEMYSRFLGYLDFTFYQKNYAIWDISETTKDVKSSSLKQLQLNTSE